MDRNEIERLIYGEPEQQRRFTQDFPILPDVWLEFAKNPNQRMGLLLTPHSRTHAAALAKALRQRLEQEQAPIEEYRSAHPRKITGNERPRILFNEAVVFVDFTFEEVIRVAIPLTDWWSISVAKLAADVKSISEFVAKMRDSSLAKQMNADPRLLSKMIKIVGAIEFNRDERPVDAMPESAREVKDEQPSKAEATAFEALLVGLTKPYEDRGLLYSISRNREAKTSVWRSRMAVKADAAARLFQVDTSGIRWAVLDTGVDATHPAFFRRIDEEVVKEEKDEHGRPEFASRIVRTYDFLRVKDLLDPKTDIVVEGTYAAQFEEKELKDLKTELQRNLDSDRPIDWSLLEPFLRIPHVKNIYEQYRDGTTDSEGNRKGGITDSHGTHVAGIIAANWPDAKRETSLGKELHGICPDLELYDLRVLGPGADEFTVIAALQFVRHLNAHKDLMAIHGVNLSMAVTHDVANYACGRTPVCEECERVVANGVVVVTAAGNRGFNRLASPEDGAMGDYRYISITDPGNAENVITVGSTHRFMPHNYGVSYFSSRGPTGDGRTKPDLVAPGERIDSCALNNDFDTMDGTSMAAPHVSGAAALLIARHRELIGHSRRVKEILCKSATDLGREPRFQGAGMLDVLRALQSV